MNRIIAFLSKLPIASWLKPVWKKALKWGITAAGEALRSQAKTEIAHDGPKAKAALLELLGEWKDTLTAHIQGSIIPDGVEEQMIQGITSAYNQMVSGFNTIEAGSAIAVSAFVDREIDKAETFLQFKVDLL
jgi:hypothetical protein